MDIAGSRSGAAFYFGSTLSVQALQRRHLLKGISEQFQAVVSLPFGAIGISMEEGKLRGIEYLDQKLRNYCRDAPGLDRVLRQIETYLKDPTRGFDLELRLHGSPFQQRVWQALCTIPSGKTLTYGELAMHLESGARAVGGACRANPCPLVIPCHRVVARRGLGGFAGETSGRKLAIKRWLLRHEGWL